MTFGFRFIASGLSGGPEVQALVECSLYCKKKKKKISSVDLSARVDLSAHLNSWCAGPALQSSPVGFAADKACCAACAPGGCCLLLAAMPVRSRCRLPSHPCGCWGGMRWLGEADELLSESADLRRPWLPTAWQTLLGPVARVAVSCRCP